jgi:adenylate cyclase
MVGLAQTLVGRVTILPSDDPKSDITRAEDLAEQAVVAEPGNSAALDVKANVFFAKRQWPQAIAEAEAAIADNPNNADAHALHSFWKMFLGRSEDGFSGLETAFRLSPRDPGVPAWQFYVCHLHTHLAQWEQAIEWYNKSVAGGNGGLYPLVDLAAANAWAGHDKRPKRPWRNYRKPIPASPSRHGRAFIGPTIRPSMLQYARIVEGLCKAGLPEGEKPMDAAAAKTSN